jgi:hypothetical protein
MSLPSSRSDSYRFTSLPCCLQKCLDLCLQQTCTALVSCVHFTGTLEHLSSALMSDTLTAHCLRFCALLACVVRGKLDAASFLLARYSSSDPTVDLRGWVGSGVSGDRFPDLARPPPTYLHRH